MYVFWRVSDTGGAENNGCNNLRVIFSMKFKSMVEALLNNLFNLS